MAPRTGTLAAGRPMMVNLSRAARMFAGNMAINRTARQIAAARAVTGTSNPTAPRISSTPVIVTIAPTRGNAGGTIRIKSARPLPQCADAVTRNIKQSAILSGRSQLLRAATPRSPTPRKTANETNRIISGITGC